MSSVQCIRSPDPEGERLAFITGCRRLGFGEVLAVWRDEPAVRDLTLAALAASSHRDFLGDAAARPGVARRPVRMHGPAGDGP